MTSFKSSILNEDRLQGAGSESRRPFSNLGAMRGISKGVGS